MFDPTLAAIKHAGQRHDARYWVERIGDLSDDIRECALDRLVERGILERKEDRFLWVFRSRRYPLIGGKAEREVKQRIMGVLFSDEIPSRATSSSSAWPTPAASSRSCCPPASLSARPTASSRCASST